VRFYDVEYVKLTPSAQKEVNMNINILIEDCLSEINSNANNIISITNKALRLAYKLKNYELVIFLTAMQQDYTLDEKTITSESLKSIKNLIGDVEYSKLSKKALEKSIKARSILILDKRGEIEKTAVVGYDLNKISELIDFYNDQLSRNQIPTGLTPVDLYFVKQEKQKIDLTIGQILMNLKTIVSRVKREINQYLITIETDDKTQTELTIPSSRKVFIIHGHDEKAKYELKSIISDILHLEPVLLSEQPDIGMTIIEKFEYYAKDCVYAFAIFTPDDIAENNGNQYFQARPNVIFELGWFYSNIGRSRTCLIMKNDKNMGIFSDLQGVIQKRFYESVKEISREIEIEIKAIGLV
jgi:predicted nucleotide-binding protein